MKKIYIILTNTGTVISRIVKIYTRKKYGHVSIALDKKLKNMYSFGRLKATNPFIGGFVHESKYQAKIMVHFIDLKIQQQLFIL